MPKLAKLMDMFRMVIAQGRSLIQQRDEIERPAITNASPPPNVEPFVAARALKTT